MDLNDENIYFGFDDMDAIDYIQAETFNSVTITSFFFAFA